jgi:hypothetical protein
MRWWARMLWATLLLALSGPLWVLGLALVPPYLIERLCTRWCWAVIRYFRTASTRVEIIRAEPLSSRDRYLAKARKNRKRRGL